MISFDESGIQDGSVRIEYNDVTDLRMFGTDWYVNRMYEGRWWVIEIESEKKSIKARFNGKPATPAHEAFDQICALVHHHVTPKLINRVVAMIRDPKADFMFGPVRLTHAGISKCLCWPIWATLDWSEFAECRWQGTRILIQQKKPTWAVPVWWSGPYTVNMGCVFVQVVNACHRARVLGETKTVVAKGPPPKAISTSPEFAAAKIILTDRPFYTSDYGFDPIMFSIAAVACWVASLVAAGVMSALYVSGLYLFIVVPALISLGLRIILMLGLRISNCRNPILGVLLGISCGLICFFGRFLFTMLWQDPYSILRLDQFFSYVLDSTLSMKTYHGAGEAEHDSFGAVLITCLDFLLIMWVTGWSCLNQSRAAWCHECKDWMKREVVRTNAGTTARFIMAFSSLDPATIRGFLYYRTARSNRVHTRIMVEYSPQFTGSEPAQVFLSVGEYQYETMFSIPFPKKGEIYRVKFTRKEIERVLKIFTFEPRT